MKILLKGGTIIDYKTKTFEKKRHIDWKWKN